LLHKAALLKTLQTTKQTILHPLAMASTSPAFLLHYLLLLLLAATLLFLPALPKQAAHRSRPATSHQRSP
jgi:hypothetical protein